MQISKNNLNRYDINTREIQDPGKPDAKTVTGVDGFHKGFGAIIGWVAALFNKAVAIEVNGTKGKEVYYLNCNSLKNWYDRVSRDIPALETTKFSSKDMRNPAKVEEMIALVKSNIALKANRPLEVQTQGNIAPNQPVVQLVKQPLVLPQQPKETTQEAQPKSLSSEPSSSKITLYSNWLGGKEKFDQLPPLDLSSIQGWIGNKERPERIPFEAVKAPVMRGVNGVSGFEYLVVKFKVHVDGQDMPPGMQVFWARDDRKSGTSMFDRSGFGENCHGVLGKGSYCDDLLRVLGLTVTGPKDEENLPSLLQELLAKGELKIPHWKHKSKIFHIKLTSENS